MSISFMQQIDPKFRHCIYPIRTATEDEKYTGVLTSHSSFLLRLMRPSVRPHGVSLQTFPRLPVRFTHHGYGCLWDFAVLSQLIHMVRLISAVTAMDTATSCPSGHDFAIPSSRLFLTVQTLGVAIGFVGNYAPWDFHPRFGTCPSH